MKTYNNNPPVKFSQLNRDQKRAARYKMVSENGIYAHEYLDAIADGERLQIFIVSPTSVAIKKVQS